MLDKCSVCARRASKTPRPDPDEEAVYAALAERFHVRKCTDGVVRVYGYAYDTPLGVPPDAEYVCIPRDLYNADDERAVALQQRPGTGPLPYDAERANAFVRRHVHVLSVDGVTAIWHGAMGSDDFAVFVNVIDKRWISVQQLPEFLCKGVPVILLQASLTTL